MSTWRNQRGKINLGCIVGLIVVIAVVVVGIKTAPVLSDIADFQNTIDNEADRANLPRHTDEVIKKKLMDKAADLHLPVQPENIVVKRTKSSITIRVQYTYEIRYPGYTFRKLKIHEETRPLF